MLKQVAAQVGESGGPGSLRFLLSAHASLEDLFVIGRLGGAFGIPEEGVAVSWRRRVKPQPPGSKFKIPPIDAPNVRGARDLGFPVTASTSGDADLSAFRVDVQSGKVGTLYVFDPGPAGTIGDLSWVIAARKSGALKTLIVHGVLMNDLAAAADIVLPGSTWVEKDASYVNGQGRLQASARVIEPPGDAQEDWQVLVNIGLALGGARHVRQQ